MINHYFFLRQLGFQLNEFLPDAVLEAIYSTSIHELHFLFTKESRVMVLKLNWETEFSLLHWSEQEEHHQARHYEKQLFSAWGKKVLKVRAVKLERLLCLELEEGATVWLKMFGKMGNAILIENGKVASVFRRSRQKDFEFDAQKFEDDRATYRWSDLCNEDASGSQRVIKSLKWPAFERATKNAQDDWFCSPTFDFHRDVTPTLLGNFSVSDGKQDYLALATAFWRAYLPQWVLIHTKEQQLKSLRTNLEKIRHRISEANERIIGLQNNTSYEQLGHLIMGYAHAISPKSSQVQLPSFEDPDQLVPIKLNPNLSPYDNANRYYQKSKNQHIEVNKLIQYINDLTNELVAMSSQLAAFEAAESMRDLNKLLKKATQADQVSKPWKVLLLGDFEVWIGKNATGNDELLRHVHKDDIWLHARKVTGSHVVIRSAGKTIPKDILQQAASWAAWFSKGKNEALCPVIHTVRKYVRKRKGSAAGSVLVEKEEVILVPPLKPNLPND